jgi:putative thioredoxin
MGIDVTDASFQKEVVEKSIGVPVIVDFWAGWCGPCMMLKPMLEKVTKEYGKKIVFAKLDVQENPEKAGEYNIMSIPNVKVFKNGEVVDEFTGVMPEEKIREFINANL